MTRVYFSEGSNFFTPVFGLNFLVGPEFLSRPLVFPADIIVYNRTNPFKSIKSFWLFTTNNSYITKNPIRSVASPPVVVVGKRCFP